MVFRHARVRLKVLIFDVDVKRSVEEVKVDPVVAPVESKPQELEKEDSNDSFAIVRSTIGMGEDELPVQPQVPLQKAASKSSVHEIPLQKAASVKMEPVVQKQASQESIESEGGSMEIVRSTIGMGEDELPKEPLQRTLSVKFSDQLVIGATGSKTNLAGPSDPIDRKSSLKKSTNELSKPIGSEEDVTAQDGEISLVVPLQPIKQEDPLTARKVAMEEPRLAKGASLKRKQMRAVTELEAEEEYQPRSNTTPNRFTSITRDELEQTIET
jgi:hypothetical protein